jgi:hypothetical protein
MNIEKILAISGKPGLYELKIQTRTGFVAESLLDGKKITVNLKANVSLLSEISVYTYDAEKPLAEILNSISKKEKNGPAISHKEDATTLAAYFKEILPDYDEERVYGSDIKKIINWYNLLQSKGLVKDEAPKSSSKEESVTEENPKKAKATKA